ncbi:RTA1 like protein-domain-containing protein [Rhodocollybia butyracea]|uniref:RTA1 like protein-domain-containing protein n=1 Tax=Rhodocollybia butyracea TaxID=206335 RepID=A0A9P5PZ25_9AGAR|nr:RTA1 like protein-domain-containing protein [Rhodocollybia butyracea]
MAQLVSCILSHYPLTRFHNMLDTYSTSSLHSRVNGSDPQQSQVIEVPGPYGYIPSFSIAVLFLSLFGVTTVAHFIQAWVHRKWFFLYTAVFAGAIELVGWYGREWASRDVFSVDAFTIQIVCTIVAPTPLLAANFIILSRLIKKLGESYSRLGPRLYSRIFVSCDVFGFFVQVGGGLIASGRNAPASTVNLGSHVMLGGVLFQFFVIICYMSLAAEYFWRFTRQRPIRRVSEGKLQRGVIDDRMKLLIYAVVFNTGCLLIRSIYRTIELADGFEGKVIQTQWLFNVFDATMVTLAMFAYNFLHFGRLVDESDSGMVGVYSEYSEFIGASIPMDSRTDSLYKDHSNY